MTADPEAAVQLPTVHAAVAPRGWRDDTSDAVRQELLASSDDLLDELERLRLLDRQSTPPDLRTRIATLRRAAGLPARPIPVSIGAAHDLLLAMQEGWLALNPRHPAPDAAPVRRLPREAWRRLSLPPLPDSGPDDTWRSLARATVERAFDRWCWAQHHATRAAREGGDATVALDRAGAAWANYFRLEQDATRLEV